MARVPRGKTLKTVRLANGEIVSVPTRSLDHVSEQQARAIQAAQIAARKSASRPTHPIRSQHTPTGSQAKRRASYDSRAMEALADGLMDSGQVGHFRPADHHKPQARSLMQRVLRTFMKAEHIPPPERTTELGASAAASPSTYEMSLIVQRYDRRYTISDCRQQVVDDPRARRALLKFAGEAVRKGIVLTVSNSTQQESARRAGKAQAVLDDVQKLLTKSKLRSWAWMLPTEGDLFVQAVLDTKTKQLVGLKRMPTAAMERNTDDTDEFVDPEQAFSQVDIVTNSEVETFPLALMYHQRWNHIDGERYGTPETIASRRMRRLLELMETAQQVRRMTRAAQARLWNIGTEDYPGRPEDVNKFKEDNAFLEGKREIFDPLELSRDFFADGLVSAEVLEGDAGVSDIEDLMYFQNIYASAGLPTPPAIYGLDAENVNRDVMDDLRAEWNKETQILSDAIEEVVRWSCDLALLLNGILPETVDYRVKFSFSSNETPSEILQSIVAARTVMIGQNAMPLISQKTAVQAIAEYFEIDDVEAEMDTIQQEQDFQDQRALALQHAQNELEAQAGGIQSAAQSGVTNPQRAVGGGGEAPGIGGSQAAFQAGTGQGLPSTAPGNQALPEPQAGTAFDEITALDPGGFALGYRIPAAHRSEGLADSLQRKLRHDQEVREFSAAVYEELLRRGAKFGGNGGSNGNGHDGGQHLFQEDTVAALVGEDPEAWRGIFE